MCPGGEVIAYSSLLTNYLGLAFPPLPLPLPPPPLVLLPLPPLVQPPLRPLPLLLLPTAYHLLPDAYSTFNLQDFKEKINRKKSTILHFKEKGIYLKTLNNNFINKLYPQTKKGISKTCSFCALFTLNLHSKQKVQGPALRQDKRSKARP